MPSRLIDRTNSARQNASMTYSDCTLLRDFVFRYWVVGPNRTPHHRLERSLRYFHVPASARIPLHSSIHTGWTGYLLLQRVRLHDGTRAQLAFGPWAGVGEYMVGFATVRNTGVLVQSTRTPQVATDLSSPVQTPPNACTLFVGPDESHIWSAVPKHPAIRLAGAGWERHTVPHFYLGCITAHPVIQPHPKVY